MANDTQVTVVGNLTADPNLRYTQSGIAVADFTVASTPRSWDKASGQFKDGETLFLRCSVWREYAENVAESLSKGTQVIVQGKLVQRSYTPRDGGEKRTVVELQVDEVGPTLRWAKAQVQRTPRRGGGFNASAGASNDFSAQPTQAPQGTDFSRGSFGGPAGGSSDDPWGTPGTASFDSEPPF